MSLPICGIIALSFSGISETMLSVVSNREDTDAAFIKEKFGYDITVGADKPEKEKSE